MHRMRRLRGSVSKRVSYAIHFRESLAPCIFAAGPSRTRKSRSENGQRDGCRRIRQLHKYLRMRSSLSGRDQRQFHCETESRIREGAFTRERGRLVEGRAPSCPKSNLLRNLLASPSGRQRHPLQCVRLERPKFVIELIARPLGDKIDIHIWPQQCKNRRARA